MSDYNMPGQQSSGADQMGAIELKTSFFVLAFLLFLFPTKAVIDGGAELNQGWGSKVYPIPAGRHNVRVWCPYFGVIKIGDGVYEVDVVPGGVVALEWKCPWLIFLPAKWVPLGGRALTQQDLQGGPRAMPQQNFPAAQQAAASIPATSATPAGWHPDPQGQAAMRYWDGQQWTEHTSDGQPTA